MIRVASWNACLGAFNKIDFISHLLNSESLDILFIQEAEIPKGTKRKLLGIKGYNTYYDEEREKARIICYVRVEIEAETEISRTVDAISVKTQDITFVGVYRPFKLDIDVHPTHMSYLNDLIHFVKKVERVPPHLLWLEISISTLQRYMIAPTTELTSTMPGKSALLNCH